MEAKGIKTLTLPVEGMTCASCVARVENALKKVDGVGSVNVNFATENVTLSFDDDQVDLIKLASIVEDAGYKLATPAKEEQSSESSEIDYSKTEIEKNLLPEINITKVAARKRSLST